MPFSRFDRYFSKDDCRILGLAYQRACHLLGRHPKHSSHADRLARTILTFFDQGQRDFGRLAGMAVKRELQAKDTGNTLEYPAIVRPMELWEMDKHLS